MESIGPFESNWNDGIISEQYWKLVVEFVNLFRYDDW